jgi:hypothetical protein
MDLPQTLTGPGDFAQDGYEDDDIEAGVTKGKGKRVSTGCINVRDLSVAQPVKRHSEHLVLEVEEMDAALGYAFGKLYAEEPRARAQLQHSHVRFEADLRCEPARRLDQPA